jgi:hypothetical protein
MSVKYFSAKKKELDIESLFHYIPEYTSFSEEYELGFQKPDMVLLAFEGGLNVGVRIAKLIKIGKKEEISYNQYREFAKGIVLSIKDQIDTLISSSIDEEDIEEELPEIDHTKIVLPKLKKLT